MNELLNTLNGMLLLIFQIINALIGSYIYLLVLFTVIAFVWLVMKYVATRFEVWKP